MFVTHGRIHTKNLILYTWYKMYNLLNTFLKENCINFNGQKFTKLSSVLYKLPDDGV